jgi:hypothetical protein
VGQWSTRRVAQHGKHLNWKLRQWPWEKLLELHVGDTWFVTHPPSTDYPLSLVIIRFLSVIYGVLSVIWLITNVAQKTGSAGYSLGTDLLNQFGPTEYVKDTLAVLYLGECLSAIYSNLYSRYNLDWFLSHFCYPSNNSGCWYGTFVIPRQWDSNHPNAYNLFSFFPPYFHQPLCRM